MNHTKTAEFIVQQWNAAGGVRQRYPGIALEDAVTAALTDAEQRAYRRAAEMAEAKCESSPRFPCAELEIEERCRWCRFAAQLEAAADG